MSYAEFLAAKQKRAAAVGIEPGELSPMLKPFQKWCTEWALRQGRAALFQGCGLGKSWQAIEWASVVAKNTRKPVLILTPLAVAPQFEREAAKMGHYVRYVRDPSEMADGCLVYVTNYDRIDKFESVVSMLGGVVLDESSILKAFDGKTRTRLIEVFAGTPYRLCCTATPSPNDPVELGNHAEFLGVMRHVDMQQRFFEHDAGDTGNWVLKGHARRAFWRWVATWAICLNKPSDIGFDDTGYDLPPLEWHEHVVTVESVASEEKQLSFSATYEASTLGEQRVVRRESMAERVAKAAEIVNADREQWIVWAALNPESEALTKAIDGAIEVTGSQSADEKEARIMQFLDGNARVLVTKMGICGFGLNAQVVARQLFVGIEHSFESQYQAVRRSWRFGQSRPVHAHQIRTSADGRIMANIRRKQEEFNDMHRSMVEVIRGS